MGNTALHLSAKGGFNEFVRAQAKAKRFRVIRGIFVVDMLDTLYIYTHMYSHIYIYVHMYMYIYIYEIIGD